MTGLASNRRRQYDTATDHGAASASLTRNSGRPEPQTSVSSHTGHRDLPVPVAPEPPPETAHRKRCPIQNRVSDGPRFWCRSSPTARGPAENDRFRCRGLRRTSRSSDGAQTGPRECERPRSNPLVRRDRGASLTETSIETYPVIHDPTSFAPAADELRLGIIRGASPTGEGSGDPSSDLVIAALPGDQWLGV